METGKEREQSTRRKEQEIARVVGFYRSLNKWGFRDFSYEARKGVNCVNLGNVRKKRLVLVLLILSGEFTD